MYFTFLFCSWECSCDDMTVALSRWAVCLYQHWLYSSWEKTFQVILIREWNLDPFLGAINRREFSGMHYICASEYLNICVVFVCVEYYHCVALQMPVLIKKEKEKVLCCKRLLLFRFFRPLWLFASRSVTSLHLGFKSTHIPPEFGGL